MLNIHILQCLYYLDNSAWDEHGNNSEFFQIIFKIPPKTELNLAKFLIMANFKCF